MLSVAEELLTVEEHPVPDTGWRAKLDTTRRPVHRRLRPPRGARVRISAPRWMVRNTEATAGFQGKEIRQSVDGGSRWTLKGAPIPAEPKLQVGKLPGYGYPISVIFFADGTAGCSKTAATCSPPSTAGTPGRGHPSPSPTPSRPHPPISSPTNSGSSSCAVAPFASSAQPTRHTWADAPSVEVANAVLANARCAAQPSVRSRRSVAQMLCAQRR